jgi:Predicted pPIWI-associating nuclease
MHGLDVTKLAELEKRLAPLPAHLRQTLLAGAVASFNDASNPARFTNTGNLLRELLRELFAALSPDGSIRLCRWFIPDETSKTGVTRRHRTLFAVYSYLDPDYFPTNLIEDVNDLAREIRSQVEVLSSFAHPTAATVGTPENVATDSFNSALELFISLFEAIDAARQHVMDALQMDLQEHLADLFTNDFFDDLDTLSTHTRPQDADGIVVTTQEITDEAIRFSGTGIVYCDLQYGSDGDCRRGDGVEWKDSFPFTFTGHAPISEPKLVSVEPADITIDTGKYYDENSNDAE